MSKVPSVLSRAIRLRDTPPTVVKPPTITSFPSACTAVLSTVLFTPGLKPGSTPPGCPVKVIWSTQPLSCRPLPLPFLK